MPIRYSAVFGDGDKLAENPVAELPNLAKTLETVISSVPRREYRRQTVEDTDVNYHYLSNGEGRIVGCVTTKDVKTRVVFNFLDAVEGLVRGTVDPRAAKKMLQQKMDFHNDPANDKISAVQESIDNAKNIMTDNVDKALARGDHIDTLHAKSVKLEEQSAKFNKKAGDLKRQMCMRNAKFAILIGGAVLILILIVLMIICKPNFNDCK
jgi:vesicle-associated membrane protein 7